MSQYQFGKQVSGNFRIFSAIFQQLNTQIVPLFPATTRPTRAAYIPPNKSNIQLKVMQTQDFNNWHKMHTLANLPQVTTTN